MRATTYSYGFGIGRCGGADAGGQGGSAPPHYDPALYGFADDFDTGAPSLRKRPGWQVWTPDYRIVDQFAVAGGALATNNGGYGGAIYALTDSGRTDSLFFQATVASLPANLTLRTADVDNYVYVFLGAAGTSNVQIGQSGVAAGAGVVGGDLVVQQRLNAPGDVWRFQIADDSLTAFVNGVRWPNGSTSWAIPNALRTGRSGFASFGGAGGSWDDVSSGYLGATPLVRLTLDPLRRLYQRGVDRATKALAISGTHAGLNNTPECRLLNAATGAAVPGWSWGQKALTGFTQTATTWSAATAPIPQGDGYFLQVRDPANPDAGSTSRRFGVGILIAAYGQSNSRGMGQGGVGAAQTGAFVFTGAADIAGSQPVAGDMLFDSVPTSAYGHAQVAGILSAAAGVPVGVVPGGSGGQPIANLVPSSSYTIAGWTKTIWAAFEEVLAAAGGDVEALVYTQGESDAGPSGGAGLSGATLANYKAGLGDMYARLRAVTGRTPSQLPFLIHGLGRVANKANGAATSPNWRDLRRAQYEWCRDTPGALLGSHAIDVSYNMGEDPAWHRTLDASGYGEDAKRIGAALKTLYGYASTDRRGPVPTGIARAGSTIVVSFAANGATSLTCAAAIASNVEFATDSGFATPLTPTGMTIDSASQVTFAFASAPPAGSAMRGPSGINPDVANALKDGATGVMTWPVYDALIAA